MSKSHSTINEKSSQWQSGLPSNLPVKTSDVLGYDLDEDMTEEDSQTKVKTVRENQPSFGKTERKQQSNFVENRKEKGDDAFEHESHDFHKHSCPSHFTGEKSELEKKDDEATAELLHHPNKNEEQFRDPQDNKHETSPQRMAENDNKSSVENMDNKEKGHSNSSKFNPRTEGKEHDQKMEKPKEVSFINPKYDKSAGNDHKNESDENLENENLPKTKGVKRRDDQFKTQQSNNSSSSSSSSDDSDNENNSNDRKGTDKTKLKDNLVQGGNAGDTDGDMDPSETDKSGLKNKADSDSDVKDSNASEEKTTFKNPKSANVEQRQPGKKDDPNNELKNHQKSDNKKEEEKEINQSDAQRNDDAKIIANNEHETLGDRVRNTGVEIDASKANTFGPKDFGFLKDDKNEDNDDPKKCADKEKQRNNESSNQDINDKVSKKDEEDKNSMKQWIENLVTNDTPKSDDTSNETMDGKKCREFHNKK